MEEFNPKNVCSDIREISDVMYDSIGDSNTELIGVAKKLVNGARRYVMQLFTGDCNNHDTFVEDRDYAEARDLIVDTTLNTFNQGTALDRGNAKVVISLADKLRKKVDDVEVWIYKAPIKKYEEAILLNLPKDSEDFREKVSKFMQDVTAIFDILLLQRRSFDDIDVVYRSYELRKEMILGRAQKLEPKQTAEIANALGGIDSHLEHLKGQLVQNSGQEAQGQQQEITQPQPAMASLNHDTGENNQINDTDASASLARMTYPAVKDADIRKERGGRSEFNRRLLARWKAAQASPDKK